MKFLGDFGFRGTFSIQKLVFYTKNNLKHLNLAGFIHNCGLNTHLTPVLDKK